MSNLFPLQVRSSIYSFSPQRHLYFVMFVFLYLSSLTSDFQTFIRFVLFFTVVTGFYTHLTYKVPKIIYLYATIFFLVYVLGQFYFNNGISDYVLFLRYSCYILLGAYFSVIFYDSFWFYYDKVMYVLVIISLFFFVLQLLNFNILYSQISHVYNNLGLDFNAYEGSGTKYVNAIVYTINNNSDDDYYRNSGFVFEPGYFSTLISFAIFNILIVQKDRSIPLVRLFIYVVGIITTVSTTGFLIFTIILFTYLTKMKGVKLIYLTPLFIIVFIFIFQLPFVYDKISNLLVDRKSYDEQIQIAFSYRSNTISLGRFEGFVFHFLEVYNRSPFFGFIGIKDSLYVSNISSANGLGYMLYYFGFFGLSFIIFLLYKSCKVLLFGIDYISFFVLVLISLFSFPYLNALIFWFFLMRGTIPKYRKTIY